MTPEEWLGLVHWLAAHDVKLTADIAVKYGAALQPYDADRVRQAIGVIVDRQRPFMLQAVLDELARPSSKWAGIIEQRHRELHPNGCSNLQCDLCRRMTE